MKTLRNTPLFKNLEKAWLTISYEGKMPNEKYRSAAKTDMDVLWKALYEPGKDHIFIDSETPCLAGGLDHIEVTKGGFYFHDVGCNTGGTIHDNSFVIRKKL